MSIIPYPSQIQPREGSFFSSFPVVFLALSGLVAALDEAGFAVGDSSENTLSLVADEGLGDEGYRLSITSDGIKLVARTNTGLFYGIQTLRQLATRQGDGVGLPALELTDRPRYKWRGFMLDSCRHFWHIDKVKQYIDVMAAYKLNRFHWHLTEDQGWRIEIKAFPELTEVGAWRTKKNPEDETLGRYGGWYSQEEIADVIQYAAQRHITVVPEIGMPGHSTAALSSHPELSCTGGSFEPENKWGVFDDIYCAGKEATFAFLEKVLEEVIDLFPSEYIHIGGDEAPKTRWEACPDCCRRMEENGLHDGEDLQSYFVSRIERYLNSKGRRLIGWDEILEGGLAPNATVMSWRGSEGGITAAKAGHDAVMTPWDFCYFDHYQGPP
ncbi:MAG: beta-N-acetylhexosaminidase, partial [bacterium]